jgi:hypothetical protein
MKAVVALAVLVATGCAAGSEPETVTTDEAIGILPVLSQVNTSCLWIPGKTCYGLPNDGNNIWPDGVGITSVQVLTRSGPDRLNHAQQTFLAFVVWNRTVVGRIFRVDIGTNGANWRAELSNITATRTFNGIDNNTGSTGSVVAGPVHPPHPNVDVAIVFDTGYLDAVKRYAAIIDSASDQFLATRAPVIDGVGTVGTVGN